MPLAGAAWRRSLQARYPMSAAPHEFLSCLTKLGRRLATRSAARCRNQP